MRPGTAALPDGTWANGRVSDPGAVGQALRLVVARNEMTVNRCLIAVSDSIATFRVLELDATATDQQVGVAVTRELVLDPERFASRWVEVSSSPNRLVYAAAWDRAAVKAITDAVHAAGLEPVVMELKSAALARTVADASYILLDLSARPAEIVLVDQHVPRQWHAFEPGEFTTDDGAESLAAPLRSVIRFHQRKRGSTFDSSCPILVSSEQAVPFQVLSSLSELVAQPVRVMVAPPRVSPAIRYPTYLTCIGLMMRRES